MQYGFTTAELKTPAVTRAEAFWISQVILVSLSITNNTPGAISRKVGGFITGYAISESMIGAAMGAGVGFFTDAVTGAVTPLFIRTSGCRSRWIHRCYDGEDLVGKFGMFEDEGKGGCGEEGRSESAED